MTQMQLLMIVMAIAAFYNFNNLRRLAPQWSEAPLKAIAALLVAGAYLFSTLQGIQLPQWLELSLITVVIVYALSSLIVLSLGRANAFGMARFFSELLYWTPAGHEPFYHLLAQMALQQGKTSVAHQFSESIAQSVELKAQIYALEENWQALLALPSHGANGSLLQARVQALLATGQRYEADSLLEELQHQLDKYKNAASYRAYRLAKARICADKGQLAEVQAIFREGVPNTAPHIMLGILAQAAENTGDPTLAKNFYRDGYRYAPKGHEATFVAKLEGEPLPDKIVKQRRSYGTYALLAFLALCFGLQLWLGDNVAHAIAAYLNLFEPRRISSEWWRYMTYAFVHGSILHIAMNLWVLFDVGRIYEQRRDWGNLLMAFVFGSVMGAYITHIVQMHNPLILVGASGGILGVGGALLADTLRARDPQNRHLRNALFQWIAMIVLFSFAIKNVSLEGHVGGFIGGLLWGFIRQGIDYSRMQYLQRKQQLEAASIGKVQALENVPMRFSSQQINRIIGIIALLFMLVSVTQMLLSLR